MSLTGIALVCVLHCLIVRSFSCPDGQYSQPNKGCTPCATVCWNNNRECRYHCPDYFRKPDPMANHGMVEPMQPPKVEIAPGKIIKDVPVPSPKPDVSKSKKENNGAFPTENSQTGNDKSNALLITLVVIAVLVFIILGVTAIFIAHKMSNNMNGRQRTVERDIEMQVMNTREEIEELLGDGAVAVQNHQAIENQAEDEQSVSEVLEMEDVTNDVETDDERPDRHDVDPATATHAEAAHAQAVPCAFCEIHTPETPKLTSQPESQIGTIEPSVTESEIPSPEIDSAQSTFPSPETQVPGLTINTGEVHRQPGDFGVYAVQFEPPPNGPTNYIAEVDDAETSAKTPAQAGEQRNHATTEISLPYPIQATPSCHDVSAIGWPVQALDDNGIPSPEGAVGGLEISVNSSNDFNNQDYAIHDNRQSRPLPPGVPLHHHTDVGWFFQQPSPEERASSTSEEESSDVENS